MQTGAPEPRAPLVQPRHGPFPAVPPRSGEQPAAGFRPNPSVILITRSITTLIITVLVEGQNK